MALRRSVLFSVVIAMAASAAGAQTLRVAPIQPSVAALQPEQRVLAGQNRLGPSSRAFIAQEGARIANTGDTAEAPLRARVGQAGLGTLSAGDVESLVQIVMMQAAQDAADDLRGLLDEMKAQNARKDALRQPKGNVRSPAAAQALPVRPGAIQPVYTLDRPGREPLQRQVDGLKAQRDSLSELSESDQLRMQLAMDRLTKLMQTLSNLLKKTSDTQSAITGNLK